MKNTPPMQQTQNHRPVIRLNRVRVEKQIEQSARLRREPTERMLRIHELVAAGKFPNGSTLANDLQVSTKTIKRDFQFMRDHFDLPLAYDNNRHGYFYSKRVDKFPGGPKITEADLFAILITHKTIEQYKGTPFYQPLMVAFQKLTGQLDSRERYTFDTLHDVMSFRPLAPEGTDMEIFKTVTSALQDCRVLKFEYRKPGEKVVEARTINPYHLICSDNRWYLIAYDPARADIRKFALGRISAPRLTGDRFTKPADFDVKKYLKGSFTVMGGTGDYEVVIEFDAWATDQLRGRQWHPSQCVTELPSGGSQMRMRLSCLEEIERWILSWGTHAHVVSPVALAERIRCIAEALLNRYTPKN
jgi:predicted DNA-binding transcriptional regulator YafY